MEIRNKSIRHTKIIGRENKFICPSIIFGQTAFGRYTTFQRPYNGRAYCSNLMAFVFRIIDNFHGIPPHNNLFRIHFMFCQIFYIHFPKIP